MRAIIIEDEKLPAEALEKLLSRIAPDIRVEAVLQTIEESVEWFAGHSMPDLAFMDIHLADGSSFAIFEQTEVVCPIIFITAYDKYALKAFEVNSVDYLLKPVTQESLERAISKFRKALPAHNAIDQKEVIKQLTHALAEKNRSYKSSILIPHRDRLIPISAEDIAYIFIDSKQVKLITLDEKSYVVENSLDELSSQLNPQDFYRANRQYIIARKAVKNLSIWFGNRLAVNLITPTPERILISRTHVREFKDWITA